MEALGWPQGSRHTAFAPYGAFEAADGTIMIGISGNKAFRRLSEALGAPEWAEDPRFCTNQDRVRNTRVVLQNRGVQCQARKRRAQ